MQGHSLWLYVIWPLSPLQTLAYHSLLILLYSRYCVFYSPSRKHVPTSGPLHELLPLLTPLPCMTCSCPDLPFAVSLVGETWFHWHYLWSVYMMFLHILVTPYDFMVSQNTFITLISFEITMFISFILLIWSSRYHIRSVTGGNLPVMFTIVFQC